MTNAMLLVYAAYISFKIAIIYAVGNIIGEKAGFDWTVIDSIFIFAFIIFFTGAKNDKK